MKHPNRPLIAVLFLSSSLIFSSFFSGCGGSSDTMPIEQVIPNAPDDEAFSNLYSRLSHYLRKENSNVTKALADTKSWADKNLNGFSLASCAPAQAMEDHSFTRVFGRNTLGVTYPWMQIYVRDGNSSGSEYLWRNVSLFVSTVLHEYFHAYQRVRQAQQILGAPADCNSAKNALTSRRGRWSSGFDTLNASASLGDTFSAPEQAMVYRWTSPILRARDEIEASVRTVGWMHEHPAELNAMTLGGANNWIYAYQYLNQLKLLSNNDCYSPNDDTFEEEKRIYQNDVPRLVHELAQREPEMIAYFRENDLDIAATNLNELLSSAAPSGRLGARCKSATLLESPMFPIHDNGTIRNVRIQPIALD